MGFLDSLKAVYPIINHVNRIEESDFPFDDYDDEEECDECYCDEEEYDDEYDEEYDDEDEAEEVIEENIPNSITSVYFFGNVNEKPEEDEYGKLVCIARDGSKSLSERMEAARKMYEYYSNNKE